jgi:2-hydroxy-6-oxonona-2,4-dienedioate hydrolase
VALPGEDASSRTLEAGGARIHYHDVGAGEPLLMLQAYGPLPGTTAWLTYHRVVDAFAQHFRCILIDNPNFGKSSPVVFDEPVHDLYVRQAVSVLDSVGIEKCKVVGTSTGGTVALDLALTFPNRVSALVIGACEASTGGDPYLLSPFPSEVARLSQDCQSNPPDRDRIRRLLLGIVYDATLITDALVESMYEWRTREPEHAESWSRSKSIPSGKLNQLATIDIPTLIIHGRFDRMVPIEGAIRLLNYIPTADLIILNNCGHWPSIERPKDFTHHALGFLMRSQSSRMTP